jgi:hypothetical protein
MLKDIDIDSLKLKSMGGSVYGAAYQQPSFPSEDELEKVLNVEEGLKIYNGNCHCKAVTYSVVTKPVEEQEVLSCNCSLCSKVHSSPPLPIKASVLIRHSMVTSTSTPREVKS